MCIQVKAAKGADIMRLVDFLRLFLTLFFLGSAVYFVGNGHMMFGMLVVLGGAALSYIVDRIGGKRG